MSLLLSAPTGVDLPAVAAALGPSLAAATAGLSELLAGKPRASFRRAALILPEAGLIALGEQVHQAREVLGPETAILVVCPQMKTTDRETVLECGAAALLTPASWHSHAVAERILAELIALGDVAPASLGSLVGATAAMQRLYGDLETMARLADPTLILGETGTGKELVAREVHRLSGRPGSLLAINCAALTPELLESELFGHERGAFSGAVTSRKGLLAEAGKGTVFLDEIGDLAPSAQAKLLRVLEERKVRPVGSNQWHPVEARILLATHRPLEESSQTGAFRQDLFERIRGFTLHLPPLRERRPDLPLLCRHFVEEYDREHKGRRTIPGGALDPLFRYSWPGNVRELRQTVRKAAAFAGGDDGPINVLVLLDAVQRDRAAPSSHQIPFDPAVDTWLAVQDRARRHYFRALLRDHGGSKEAAARKAGIGKTQLYEILKELDEPDGDAG